MQRCAVYEPSETLRAAEALTSSDSAFRAIRRAILDGTLAPGERIIEQRLASMLDVSRTPVREALQKLERENLVVRSGRSMTVRTYGADEVRDIYDLRAHLESFAARLAAERITDREVDELRAMQDRLDAAVAADAGGEGERREPARLNQLFHLLVVRAARSAPLRRTVDSVGQTPLIYKAYLWHGPDEKRRSSEAHRKLVEHLAARDAARAEDVWRRHIWMGRDVLVEGLLAHEASRDAGF
jgi:DNA-binding GntR family transcriptional regulator